MAWKYAGATSERFSRDGDGLSLQLGARRLYFEDDELLQKIDAERSGGLMVDADSEETDEGIAYKGIFKIRTGYGYRSFAFRTVNAPADDGMEAVRTAVTEVTGD